MIPRRRLGSQGPEVSALGLGCMMLTESFHGNDDLAQGRATIGEALDAGVTFLNTGDFYGMGRNETLIAEAVAARRDKVLLSVKFGALRDPKGMFYGLDLRPSLVKAYLTYSLQRLRTDYIDLYQPCRLDPMVPIEDTVGAIKDLIQAGYVRYLGLSEMGAATIRRAHAVHPVTALEFEYSIFCRDVEDEVLPVLRELGIGLVAYGVFTHGLLSGRVRSAADLNPAEMRSHLPQFQSANLANNLGLVRKLENFACDKNITLPQLAAAWVLSKEPSAVAAIGARGRAALRGWLDAAAIGIDAKDLRAIERLVPRDAVAGTRYPAEQMARVGR